jgi:hypothetical protein
MNPLIAVVVIAAVVVLVIVAWLVGARRRTEDLKSRFGSEYERTVEREGDRRSAEAELRQRQERVEALDIRPLPPERRDHYAEEWRHVQAEFVDQPTQAITQADRLVGEVMEARGYPVGDFEQRVADVSVDHPEVVEHYRVAHDIASRRDDLTVDTESLRQAMVHYRALFEDLLGASTNGSDRTPNASERTSRPTDPTLTRSAS